MIGQRVVTSSGVGVAGLAACLAASLAVSVTPSAVVSLDLAKAAQPTDSPAIRHMIRPVDRHAARAVEVTALRRPESFKWLKT